MTTFLRNTVTSSEAKKLLQEGYAECIQIHKSAGNNPVRGLDQQSAGDFFGTTSIKTAPAAPKRRLPILVTSRSAN